MEIIKIKFFIYIAISQSFGMLAVNVPGLYAGGDFSLLTFTNIPKRLEENFLKKVKTF